MTEKVNFWFDPTCPWTWITSRWLVEVSQLRDLDITWRPFSLWELNSDKDVPEKYREMLDATRVCSRVSAAVETEAPEQLGELYTVLGEKFFTDEADKNAETVGAVLESIGLKRDLLDRAENGEYDEALASSTKEALDLVGDDVGVPIIEVAGVAFFGPVISPAPHGEEAGQLWDGTLALAKVPGFFELKRSRDVGPIFS